MLQSAAGSDWASLAAGFATAGQKTPPPAVSGTIRRQRKMLRPVADGAPPGWCDYCQRNSGCPGASAAAHPYNNLNGRQIAL
jgi:hypothetical protein